MSKEVASLIEDQVREATGTSRRLHKQIQEEVRLMAVAASRGNKQHVVEDKREIINNLLVCIEAIHDECEDEAHELAMKEVLE